MTASVAAACAHPRPVLDETRQRAREAHHELDKETEVVPQPDASSKYGGAQGKAQEREIVWEPGSKSIDLSTDKMLKLWRVDTYTPEAGAKPSRTGLELFSAQAPEMLRRAILKFEGGKPEPPVLTQGKYESKAQFEERVAQARADFQAQSEAYQRRLQTALPGLQAETLRNAFYSIFGEPMIAETHYDPEGRVFSVEVTATGAQAGGFRLNLSLEEWVPTDNMTFPQLKRWRSLALGERVPTDKAEAFDRDLKRGVPRIRFALDSGNLSFADAEIIVAGRAYAANPTAAAFKQSLAQVRLEDATPSTGIASLDIRYSAPPTPESVVDLSVDDPPSARLKPSDRNFALLVGIERYPGLPTVDFAERDVKTLKKYLLTTMGFPERNVIELTGASATRSGIEKYLREWLPRNTDAKSRVLVFFAGHGAPHPASGDAFLVPYDGDPSFLQTTGLKLKDFYASLEKLPAKEVIVLADACFSGAGGRSVLAKGARPLVTQVDTPLSPTSKIVAVAASSGSEITASYEEKGHGLFTYFLLKGLRGEADKNGDGWVTLQEAYDYLRPNVQKVARRQNREQTPQLLPGVEALGENAHMKLSKVK